MAVYLGNEMVSSGGGVGGGSTGGGVFDVTITLNGETGEHTADKTKDEILEAINNHLTILFTYRMQLGEKSLTRCQWYGANIDYANNQVYTVGFLYSNIGYASMISVKFSDTGVEVVSDNSVTFRSVYVFGPNELFLTGMDNKKYRITVNGGTITAEAIS